MNRLHDLLAHCRAGLTGQDSAAESVIPSMAPQAMAARLKQWAALTIRLLPAIQPAHQYLG
jgi:hypothetical protein